MVDVQMATGPAFQIDRPVNLPVAVLACQGEEAGIFPVLPIELSRKNAGEGGGYKGQKQKTETESFHGELLSFV
jgi:hypothetical protein